MSKHKTAWFAVLLGLTVVGFASADWTRFRGPNGLGKSDEKGLPVTWSAKENIVWRTELPGAGASTPVTNGKRVYVTCYSGYGMSRQDPGNMENLMRHLVCVDRASGKILWTKDFKPRLPEHKYAGEGSYHGYAAATPTIDGDRLYVFFGKSGVYCFDLDGNQIWHTLVGDGINRWGSGASPVVHGDLLIVNASIESRALVALDKKSGKEIWRAENVRSAWNTPFLVDVPKGKKEIVVSTNSRLLAFDLATGKPLWNADGVHRYVCPSVIAHDGIVYAMGGGHTSVAVRAGGRGDVTKTHTVWRTKRGPNVSSPIYHQGYLYWTRDGSTVCCQDLKTGELVYQERLRPGPGRVWTSPVLVDGKLYYVSQENGTFVVAAEPKFKLLSHNVIEGDDSRTNGSLAVDNGQFLLRNDRYLYCIGKK